jgi:hypothetical protein
MTIGKSALLCCVISGLTGIAVWGQGLTGSISGLVKDPKGGAIPNAKVVAKNVATNAEVETHTDEIGFYRLLNLSPGDYMVSAEAPGFRRVSTSAQTLTIAQPLRVDIALEIGQVTETVVVTESTRQVNTEDAQLGFAISSIAGLPVRRTRPIAFAPALAVRYSVLTCHPFGEGLAAQASCFRGGI